MNKKRIAVFVPNWIGDVAMATPALRTLREHHGDSATLFGVMKPYVAEVLAGTDWLDQTILVDRQSSSRELQSLAVANRLRKLNLDCVILLTNSLWAGVMARWSGAKARIGYAANGRGPLLTKRLHIPRHGFRKKPLAAVDCYLQLVTASGCKVRSASLELATRPEDETKANRIWEQLGLTSTPHTVIFNTGSAASPARHWPTEHYIELARQLVQNGSVSVLVICGPGERETAETIARWARHPRVKSMAGQDLSLGVSKACIRRAAVVVTTDSGPRHIAAAFRVPTISLLGPTDPRLTFNYNSRETLLQQPITCAPCNERVCPLAHHHCMRDLSVERVLNAIRTHLAQPRRLSA